MKKNSYWYPFIQPKGLLKTLTIMKITLFLSLVSALCVNASVFSQSQKINLKADQVTIKDLLKVLEKKSELRFFYNEDFADLNRTVSVNVTDTKLGDVLDKVFTDANISYKILDNSIVVISPVSFLQQQKVIGTVTDATNGEPIIGANVIIEGTTIGTVTDASGKFNIDDVTSGAVLTVTYLGYNSERITLNGQTTFDIKLVPDITKLEEIVVIGYGTQKKGNVTTAISSVNTKDVKVAMVSDISHALQGNAAGVEVTSNSNSPGGDYAVRIRGIKTLSLGTDPLYVVDGLPLSGGLSFLNNSDIETIDILKDASAAAIYGNRGANGVILITTKKGKKGQFNVNFEASYAVQSPFNLTKMADASEYARLLNTVSINGGGAAIIANPESLGKGTDWVKEITRTAPIKNYSLNINGGADRMIYSASINYFDQNGIVKTSNYNKIAGRFNAEFNNKEKLKVGNNLFLTSDDRDIAPGEKNQYGGIFYNALNIDPITPIYKTGADYNAAMNEYSVYQHSMYTANGNPVGQLARSFENEKNFKVVDNIYASYNFFKDFTFKSSFGLEVIDYKSSYFSPNYNIAPNEKSDINSLSKSRNTNMHYVWENTLTYDKQFTPDHKATVLLGYSAEHSDNSGISASRSGFPNNSESVRYLGLGTTSLNNFEFINKSALISYFGRVNYAFKDRYLLTVSARTDGSSKFTKGNKWGTFPSVSGAWIVSSEPFFETLSKVITQLKVRAGWGNIGNQSIPNDRFLYLVRNDARYPFGNPQAIAAGYSISSPGNSTLVWETTTDQNIGIDLSLYSGKLMISADFYKRVSNDILLEVPIAEFTGIFSDAYNLSAGIYSNAGDIENKGIDVSINYRNNIGDFNYGFGSNASWVRNEVTDLGNKAYLASGNYRNLGDLTRTEVGRPMSGFYGWSTAGIFQNQQEIDAFVKDGKLIQPNAKPGDFKFMDNNNDGQINDKDKSFIGNPLPDVTYGFNVSAEYKGFDFSAYFYGVYGNTVMDGTRAFNQASNSFNNSRQGMVDDAWHGEGTSNSQPRLSSLDINQNFRFSDFYLVDGSYLKLKNVTIGYNLGKKLCGAIKVSSVRLFAGIQDAFIITKYKGFDPSLSTSNVQTLGIDYGTYPMAKTYMFGTKISF